MYTTPEGDAKLHIYLPPFLKQLQGFHAGTIQSSGLFYLRTDADNFYNLFSFFDSMFLDKANAVLLSQDRHFPFLLRSTQRGSALLSKAISLRG